VSTNHTTKKKILKRYKPNKPPFLMLSNQGDEVLIIQSVTREKLSMAKGKPQQTGMTAEINSIPTYAI
jgi:hypothetical protein